MIILGAILVTLTLGPARQKIAPDPLALMTPQDQDFYSILSRGVTATETDEQAILSLTATGKRACGMQQIMTIQIS